MGRRRVYNSITILALMCVPSLSGKETTWTPELRSLYQRSVSRAIVFLRRSQNKDGSFSSELGPGVTALAATSLLRQGIPHQDPVVAGALRYLEGFVQEDGGIYRPGSLYRNYETCLAILCFSDVTDGRYGELIDRARDFVEGIQWDESEGTRLSSSSYGGAGYGKHKRPDLSNTSFFIEALRAAGANENDDAIGRALIFLSRCQNLESQYNTLPFSTKNPDGGFYYTGAAGGVSQAGMTAGGGLRSYGSMTYAGLKSMIYAGVGPDDPRVQAAVQWIRENYDLTKNPGMGPQMQRAGLYYYYHTFAKALAVLGEARIKDTQGKEHDWRAELLQELATKQLPNGSWVNDNPRWLEGDASLVTAYALLSLSYCKPK